MAKNAVVVKSNDFVEACYKLTLDEMRVLLLTIGKIDPTVKNHHRDFEFTVAEFAECFGADEKSAYIQVQKAIDRLSGRLVVVEKNDKLQRKVTFLTEQVYFYGEGRFQVILHEKLMPLVSDIKEKFTKYNLGFIAKFNSFHAIRLYEILAQQRRLGFREIELDTLKNWLQVADKYSRWDNFKAKLLEPAITEINGKSDLFVSYETIKKGRTITGLKFLISQARQAIENTKKSAKSEPKAQEKTRKIYGVFDEIVRPQVAKGSDAEGKWANKNAGRAYKMMKELGFIKQNFILEKDYKNIPTAWLKVIKKYTLIIDHYTARDVINELEKRDDK